MEPIKFHCNNKPKNGETVQVIFTGRNEDHAVGYMTEYNCDIIMTFSQATKKKKIKSINKTIPLEKELTAILEDFEERSNIGYVSRAYIDDTNDPFVNIFKCNYKLHQVIYQICIKNNVDFNYTWKEKVYPFISTKHIDYTLSYLNTFIESLYEFESILDNPELFKDIVIQFEKINTSNIYNKKKIGIISNDGVETTKLLIKSCLNDEQFNNIKDNFNIMYSTPDYTIETKLSEEILNNFVELIISKSKQINNIFVKVY